MIDPFELPGNNMMLRPALENPEQALFCTVENTTLPVSNELRLKNGRGF